MKKETLHKMVLTTAKQQGDYGNEERYFTLTDADHGKATRRL